MNSFGIGWRSTKSVDPAEISAASGSAASTSAPPAIQLSTRRRNRSATPGANMATDAIIGLTGIGANVITGSNSVSDAARPGRRTAWLTAVQPPIETPSRCGLPEAETGQRVVQPVRLIVGVPDRLVLNGQSGLAQQVDAIARCAAAAAQADSSGTSGWTRCGPAAAAPYRRGRSRQEVLEHAASLTNAPRIPAAPPRCGVDLGHVDAFYSTVTDLARLRGLSTS